MGDEDYKEAWGVVDLKDGLDVRTVSDTRRAAIINWLVVEASYGITSGHTDERIETLWEKERGDAQVKQVRCYVQP